MSKKTAKNKKNAKRDPLLVAMKKLAKVLSEECR